MRNPQVEDMIVVVDMMTIVEEEEVAGTMTVAVSIDLVVVVNFSGGTTSSHSIHLVRSLVLCSNSGYSGGGGYGGY
jgi:hypothetical protein